MPGHKANCQRLSNGRNWLLCILCKGRIHHVSCTSKLRPSKDCCAKRHRNMGLPEDEASDSIEIANAKATGLL